MSYYHSGSLTLQPIETIALGADGLPVARNVIRKPMFTGLTGLYCSVWGDVLQRRSSDGSGVPTLHGRSDTEGHLVVTRIQWFEFKGELVA